MRFVCVIFGRQYEVRVEFNTTRIGEEIKTRLSNALGQATVRFVYRCPNVVWCCMVDPG